MKVAKNADKVKIHYTKKVKRGEILDSSKDSQPLEIRIGSNLVPLFENAIKGMRVGERKEVLVPPEEAHGERRKDLIVKVKKDRFPKNIEATVGYKVKMQNPNGNDIEATITNVKGDTITLDANHPLAGRALIFEIELIEVMESPSV
jgi:FKBP-type peptidyl-prolyl cis-trans isomerase 2